MIDADTLNRETRLAVDAAVDRVIAQAARYAIARDYDLAYADHWRLNAATMLSAACYAADAGHCDNAQALDRDDLTERIGRIPTESDYRDAMRRAIDANR